MLPRKRITHARHWQRCRRHKLLLLGAGLRHGTTRSRRIATTRCRCLLLLVVADGCTADACGCLAAAAEGRVAAGSPVEGVGAGAGGHALLLHEQLQVLVRCKACVKLRHLQVW